MFKLVIEGVAGGRYVDRTYSATEALEWFASYTKNDRMFGTWLKVEVLTWVEGAGTWHSWKVATA